ncbi:MAG: hypothetical protein GY796_18995 [Chloroflexi bacterium]|nr:hypothetical protein [Chloroflexota bacterium]
MISDKHSPTTQPWYAAPWIKWGAIILFVLWMFFGLSMYYGVQRPFNPTQLTALSQTTDVWLRLSFSLPALGRSLLDMLAALWLAFVALGLGLWILAILQLGPESDLETFLYAVGLGFGLLGILVLLLGMAGLVGTAVYLILFLLLTLLTAKKAFLFLRDRFRPARPSPLITVYLIIAISLTLFVALLPPTSWDAISYHLKGPQIYLAAGRIVPTLDNAHIAPIYFPNLFEMLFMLAMGLRGDVTAKLLHFLFSFFLGALVYLAARDQVQVKDPWLAVVFYYAIPMVLVLAGQAYNDLSLAFSQIVALLALFQWQRFRRNKWLVLSGLFCGLAMGHKYTSFVLPLTLTLLLLWEFRRNLWGVLRPLLIIAIPAVIVAAPFYIKNLILVGNPVYPFLFGGDGWDAYLSLAYTDPGSGLGWDPVALLRLPYDMMLGLQDVSGDGQMGPFFLIFLPLFILYIFRPLGRGATRPFHQILFYALMLYAFWTLGVISSAGLYQGRQLFTMFVILCPVIAWIVADLAQFDHPQFSLRRFVLLVLALALGLNLLGQTADWLTKASYRYVVGSDGRDETLTRLLGPHYKAMMGINRAVPPDGHVAFLWEPRSYYCQPTCQPDLLLYKFGHLEQLYGDADGIGQAWQEQGITHVLVFDAGLQFAVENEMAYIAPGDTAVFNNLLADWLEPVNTWDKTYTLYALEEIGD